MKKTEPDALTLLKEDHEMVAQLFADFKSVKSDDEKLKVMEKITDALEVHAKVEEEIFYPALRTARDTHAKSEVREAYEEHKEIKILLTALEETEPDDAEYASKVKALQQRVEHHVKEEEGEMFPDAEKLLGEEKLQSLGEEIAALQEELGSE